MCETGLRVFGINCGGDIVGCERTDAQGGCWLFSEEVMSGVG